MEYYEKVENAESQEGGGASIKQGIQSFQQLSQERSIDVSESFQEQPWNVLAAQNVKINRHVGWRLVFTLIVFLAVSGGTLVLHDMRHIACAWLAALAVMLAIDGFQFCERFLALQSRWILATMAGLLAACIEYPMRNLILVTLIVWSIGFWLVRVLNTKWLAAETMRLTTFGQQIVTTVLNTVENNLDNDPNQAYRVDGKRQTRRILSEMGIKTSENSLDIVHKLVWMAGYLSAMRKMDSIQTRERTVEKLRSSLEAAKEENGKLRAALAQANEELEEYRESSADSNNSASMIARLNSRISEQDTWINKLRVENARLKGSGSVASVVASTVPAKKEGMTDKEKAIEIARSMRENGISQNKAGSRLGLAPSSTSRLMATARQNGWLEEEG